MRAQSIQKGFEWACASPSWQARATVRPPGVLSSAQRHTHFLDSVRINAVMVKSDFAFADLKTARHV